MKNDSKPFDLNLYDADDGAKQKVMDWMSGYGWQAEVNPDQYGIDVLAERGERRLAVEVEVKHNWTNRWFPYQTVHISARKAKFARLEGREVWFTMLNDTRDTILVIDGEIVAEASIISKRTTYTDNERFITIPVEKCRFYALA